MATCDVSELAQEVAYLKGLVEGLKGTISNLEQAAFRPGLSRDPHFMGLQISALIKLMRYGELKFGGFGQP